MRTAAHELSHYRGRVVARVFDYLLEKTPGDGYWRGGVHGICSELGLEPSFVQDVLLDLHNFWQVIYIHSPRCIFVPELAEDLESARTICAVERGEVEDDEDDDW